MMSETRQGSERLAQILREMLALSETARPKHSKSAAADEPGELSSSQCVNQTGQTCVPCGKQATPEQNKVEDQSAGTLEA